jgi:predicted acetyltransferase
VDVEIRRPDPDEFDRFGQAVATAFGHGMDAEQLARIRRYAELDRDLAAYADGAMVGTAAAHRFGLTVPGGELPAAGVTAVTVQPTHRRRGILTRLMQHQLRLLREWEEPLAVLWASEGSIYPRYGYGLASLNGRLDADRDVPLLPIESEPDGQVRLVSEQEAAELFPRVWEPARAVTPGFFSRTPGWWEAHVLADVPWRARGGGTLFRAVLETQGEPQAYALYRLRWESSGFVHENRLLVEEAIGATPAATRAMWRYLFGVDLVARVVARLLPADFFLLGLAAETPRLRFSLGDGLWLRLVDVAKALAGRGYAAEGTLELELADDVCPWNASVWRLEAAPEGGRMRRVGDPELRLDASALASAYLGGFSFASLVAAGRVVELKPGAAARADSLFRTDLAPWCPETF